eukprot:6195134-Pleurochrysis_carterae.AAC.5
MQPCDVLKIVDDLRWRERWIVPRADSDEFIICTAKAAYCNEPTLPKSYELGRMASSRKQLIALECNTWLQQRIQALTGTHFVREGTAVTARADKQLPVERATSHIRQVCSCAREVHKPRAGDPKARVLQRACCERGAQCASTRLGEVRLSSGERGDEDVNGGV